MTTEFTITRLIEIDAGHRVPDHKSKCHSLHGHRYKILATCVGPLFTEGEQTGMVLDFGFLKDEMMKEVHDPCDHSMILWIDDPNLAVYFPSARLPPRSAIISDGHYQTTSGYDKIYLIPFTPTAENLAKHWFKRLAPRVKIRSENQAHLEELTVWETPNCYATYPYLKLAKVST